MGLYTRADYDRELAQLESDACVGSRIFVNCMLEPQDYDALGRLFTMFSEAWEAENEKAARDMRRGSSYFLVQKCTKMIAELFKSPFLVSITGFQLVTFDNGVEFLRSRLRGKLLTTRFILGDGKRGSCLDRKNHFQPCYCKHLKKHRDNEEHEDIT